MEPLDWKLVRKWARHRAAYRVHAFGARLFTGLHFIAPRENMQDELARTQRWFTMRAHTNRIRATEIVKQLGML